MHNFTPYSALLGGLFIGLSALLLFVLIGRIAGITGIVAGMRLSLEPEARWRMYFVGGLLGGCWLAVQLGMPLPSAPQGSTLKVVMAGFLVGAGTVISNGCTSGHGVCGISRLSKRSIIATLVFMLSAMLTVWLVGS
ncbi:YeeE/YedE family protein [Neptunicella marina]|uniref:YeeE/YedE family protein n=1 Tax=Neptunicella marina TaxID=2125989 RepID=A0A8J6ISS0_9ALTE|nr:YeeE/YedE thiosulfate transporter family protein [Neptunicella marina]MBC3765105.1 YeeE/YedE family protein [Neptunicella marina]